MPHKEFTSVVSSTGATALETPDWKDRSYEQPPDDHPIYSYVGRVCVEWARVEHALDKLIWKSRPLDFL